MISLDQWLTGLNNVSQNSTQDQLSSTVISGCGCKPSIIPMIHYNIIMLAGISTYGFGTVINLSPGFAVS